MVAKKIEINKKDNKGICQLIMRDWVFVGVIIIVLLAVWITGSILFGSYANAALMIVGVVTIIIVIFHLYRRSGLMAYELQSKSKEFIADRINHVMQIQDLLAVYAYIEPRAPFPRLTSFGATPDFLRMVAELIATKKPALVLEAGSGISTIVIGYCLEKIGVGQLVALENDREYYEKTKQMLALHGLENRVQLVHAPLVDNIVGKETFQWYDIQSLDISAPVDLLIIDGPPYWVGAMARYPAVPLFYEKFGKDAVVALDDGYREDEKIVAERWNKEYQDMHLSYIDLLKGAYILNRKQGTD